MQKVITLMREEYRRETPLSEMAGFVNLSPSRLRYLFKIEVGMAPAQYLKAFRMQRARELLETTFLSVKEIRTSIGLNDHSHFVRAFKKSYGFTPAKYRMRLAAPELQRTLEGLLILLVYNDQVSRERIGLTLEQAGACVTTMASARKALAALQRMRPHVLLVDVDLPNGEGYTLVRTARALFDERQEQIPAVALVRNLSLDVVEQVVASGFQIHLTTQSDPGQLIGEIARLTGRTTSDLHFQMGAQ
ncbi:MAG TPA: helix-turn-helix domain-containing protein [Pyrinomonadaceae bacterium]